MTDIKSLLKTEPFATRLIFVGGDATDYFDGEIFTVVCDEKSRQYAFAIKARNENAAEIIEIDPIKADELNGVFKKDKNVLAVGDKELINCVRLSCNNADNRLIAQLFDLSIAKCFKVKERVFGRNGVSYQKLFEPEKVIVDLKRLFNVNRAYYAEAFCECASIAALVAEKKLLNLIDEKADGNIEVLEDALNFVLGAKAENLFSSIICSEILLAKAFYECGELSGSDLFSVGEVLSGQNSLSGRGEATFASAKALVDLYGIATSRNLSNCETLPQYDKRLAEINELFGGEPSAFFSTFSPFPEKVCHDALKKIHEDESAARIVAKAKADLDALDDIYSLCYGGRKRRADFSEGEIKFSLLHGGYLTKGFLKYLSDSGVTEALSD